MKYTGRPVRTREKKNKYRILVGKPEGKSSLGRPTCQWEFLEKWGVKDWIHPAQDVDQ
jgi:hypothetical protein